MAGLMKAIALVAMLIAAPAAAADDGDDFSNNLFSDLAPLLALFGERVTTQFMSQAMGWADNIILAMGPLGIVTIVVSAIRVGGPIWLRAIVGRARENRAAAEEELMSSTSDEVSELWNGQKVVRVAGKASIAEFICLLPLCAGAGTNPGAEEVAMASDHFQPDNDPFEVISLEDAVRKNYLQEVNQDIPFGKEVRRVAHPIRSLWRRARKALGDLEETKGALSSEGLRTSVPNKFIIIRNKTNAAPNLLLNIDRFSSPSELWTVAAIGTILQFGVLVYSGFITYHPTLLVNFQKGGLSVAHYAYPCTAVGTLFLILGLIICSHVVESSTHEDFYRPNGFEARIVYLQKAGTVGDQSFDSFAIFAKEAKSVIATSRRNDESTKVVLEIKTVIAMLLALSGFVAQFAGLRSMNWSATIAQLVAALLMTAFRAFVRRDLARIPTTEKLRSGVELDWLATRLAFRLFHDPSDKGNEGHMATAPKTPNAKKESGRTEVQESANSWLKPSTNNHPASPPRTSSASRDTSATSRQQTWIFKVVDASEASYQETHKASIAHYAMRLRKGLGDLAPWPRPLSAEARAVVTAIESTMNYLDSQSVFSSLATKDDGEMFGISRRHHNSPKDESFVWHVETLRHGKIYFTVNKRKNGRWEASEPEIEAALSLWSSDDFLHELETDSTLTVDDVSLPRDGAMARRTLQLLGPNSARLRRDLRWWLPEEMANVMTVRAVRESTEAARATGPRDEEYHGVFGCGHSDDCPGWTEKVRYRTAELQRPYDTTSNFPGTIPIPRFPRNELLLATVREQPARGLFAQHLFTAFMWALVNKRVQRPIPGRANIQASDLSQLDVSPDSWQLFTLQNQHLSRMVQDIHAAGLGSHNDILLCIIPPLSLTHRLPQTESVVKWAHQHLIGPGMTGRWSEVVDGFIWLLGTFPDGDPIHTHLVPLAVSVLVLLAQECMVRKRQMYPKREVEELELLKSDLESMLKTASAAHHSLSVARKHSSAWITRVADTIKLGEPPFPAVEYSYPNPIRIAMEKESSYQAASDSPTRPANLGIRDAFGRTALHYIERSDRLVASLLKIRAMVNTQDCLGWSPLHFASSQHEETWSIKVARLIQAGADVGLRSLDGLTPLHCAAMAGATKSVMELVEAGADVNALDSLRNTALHWAAFLGHDEVVTRLLGLTNQELRNSGGRTVLHQLALSDDAIATPTQYGSLLQQGYDVGAKDRLGRVALHYAASNGHEEAIKSVLFPKHEADGVDMEDNRRMRPVDFAAARGHDNLAIYLIQHKTGSEQVYHRDEDGATILHHAAAGNCKSLLQSLLSVEGDGDLLSWVDWNAKATALHYATQNGSTESLELLAEAQPDMVLAKNRDGRTALHLAAMNGHLDCALYLETKLTGRGEERWPVISGPERFYFLGGGRTPLHLAVEHAGNVGMVKHLLTNGCPIDHQDHDGYTALHRAAVTGDVAVVKLLLEWKPQGTQVDATTKTRSTALACAAYNGNVETVDFLMRSGADINMRDYRGRTTFLAAAGQQFPLSYSSYWKESSRRIIAQRKIDILRLLVEAGADPHDVDREGQSAQELLFEYGYSDDDICRQLVAGYLEGLSLL